MATIKTTKVLPWFRHCQSEAHTYLIVTRGGKTSREGRGLGLWFWHIGTAISEIPINDQAVPVMFKARTQDFQEVSISGQVWYNVTDPGSSASRFDFSVNTTTGAFNADPLTVIQGALVSTAQEAVWSHVSAHTLESLLQSELAGLSASVANALAGLEFGIEITRAVVTAVRPERAVEQSLQAKTRERLQMEADAAGFERRAKATEHERAIQEAELANQLALAKSREALIAQQDENARAEASSKAAVLRIDAESKASSARIHAAQQLEAKRAGDEANREHHRALGEERLHELREKLAMHDEKQDASKLLSLSQLPGSLGNVKVLTLGDGGLSSALERIAGEGN